MSGQTVVDTRDVREYGSVPLSEDEQRVLDEIERQLRVVGPREGDATRARRISDTRSPTEVSSSPTLLLVVACVGGLASLAAGVLVGGFFGVVIAWLGFAAIVLSGVGLVRGSQAAIAAQVQLFAERYSGPIK